MKFLDLFAGIGGFRRGMEMAGHTCVGFCEYDKYATMSYTMMHLANTDQRNYIADISNLKKRQKEIMKDEYKNGEWYAADIRRLDAGSMPQAECWCFGAPCQDFSIAGKQAGLAGEKSVLVTEVFRILGETREKDRPEWLIYENVKGMLSSNRGFDYLRIVLAMDKLGYDVEWQIFNSKDWGVPQNRERVYTIGHLRRRGSAKIFPLTGADGENCIKQLGNYLPTKTRKNPNQGRIYVVDGISPCLNKMEGGGREPSVAIKIGNINPSGRGMNGNIYDCMGINPALTTNKGEGNKIAVHIDENILLPGKNYNQRKTVNSIDGISRTLIGGHSGNEPKIAIPVLTPDREKKGQNGRRFKENGDPMFTLTAQDRHGVALDPIGRIYTNDSPKWNRGIHNNGIRSLKANKSDAGVVLKVKDTTKQGYAIAHEGDAIDLKSYCSSTRRGTVKDQIAGALDQNCSQGIFVKVSDALTIYAIWYEKYQCYIAIRRLTPKECFRLQGWEDIYFYRAALVNSDSKLYKQSGNGVTVNVAYAIGKAIAELEEK